MQETPPAGGDTLWCSGYELYDRLSPPFQKFLEGLTATCAQPVFKAATERGGYPVMSPRGSPLNVDYEFSPSHPVVRTCPVTGWKSLFAGVGCELTCFLFAFYGIKDFADCSDVLALVHVTSIDGVHSYEDKIIHDYVMRMITHNHDCIARMHWTDQACAIWSNACTLHAATV